VNPEKRYANAQAVLDELELRDRQRARRPLLYLGVIGPGLLLLAMAYFLYQFMIRAEQDAQKLLTTRAVESDVQTAQVLARGVERDLRTRGTSLDQTSAQITASESLRTAIDTAGGKTKEELDVLFKELIALKERSDNFARVSASARMKAGRGETVCRSGEPYSRAVGFNYAPRLLSRTRGSHAGKAALKPIRDVHVSVPSPATTNQHGRNQRPDLDPPKASSAYWRTIHPGKSVDHPARSPGCRGELNTLALVDSMKES
jgi:hypothetical protein